MSSPSRRAVRAAAALACVAFGLLCTAAHADAGPKISPGWYLPVGIDLGGAFRGGLDNGFVLGGEVSAVRIFTYDGPDLLWLGPVADVAWDFGSDALRHRVGGEIGLGPLGVELGYIGELRDGSYMPGMGARGFLTFAIVGFYGGYGHLFEEVAGKDWGEFGVLIKIPIALCTSPSSNRPPPEPPPPLYPEPRIQVAEPPPAGPLVPLAPGPFAEPPPPDPSN
jgi:hypothetical protein